jgi:transposase InsO family protein
MDVKRLARCDAPVWVEDRSRPHRSAGAGWIHPHVVIDDHSRYLYVEQHDREDADTNAGTPARAVAHFAELGLDAPRAMMTDNALVYTRSARFKQLLERIGARHIIPPAYAPRWNGKPERVIRILRDEWAYAQLLGELPAAHPSPEIIRALLQPQATTQQPRRPASHQPRSQRPWSGQLARLIFGWYLMTSASRVVEIVALIALPGLTAATAGNLSSSAAAGDDASREDAVLSA